MDVLVFIAAFASAIWALVSLRRKRLPLFMELSAYGQAAYALGMGYDLLYKSAVAAEVVEGDAFVSSLGFAGAFFFFFTSYYGAMDSLADEGGSSLRPRRLAALFASFVLLAAGGGWLWSLGMPFDAACMLPVAATAYFSLKHALMPDVEGGFVDAIRPYNAVLLAFCLVQPFCLAGLQGPAGWLVSIVDAALLFALPIVGAKGVGRWFM